MSEPCSSVAVRTGRRYRATCDIERLRHQHLSPSADQRRPQTRLRLGVLGQVRVGAALRPYGRHVPLSLTLAVIAVFVAMVFVVGRGGTGQGRRFLGTAVLVWAALAALAIVALIIATLIFGR